MRGLHIILVWLCCSWLHLHAASEIPAKPAKYVNDYASVLADASENSLNQQLEQFERDTSNQIVVALFQKLPAGANLETFCLDTFNAWGIGQADKNNGVLLAVFIGDRRLRIQVGTGLEKALPDSFCQRIIDQEITPKFKQGDITGGVVAGAQAILNATRGEYTGTGTTVHQSQQSATAPPTSQSPYTGPVSYSTHSSGHGRSSGSGFGGLMLLVILAVVFFGAIFGDRGGTGYSSSGYYPHRRSLFGSSNRTWGRSRNSSWGNSSSSSFRSSGGFRGGGGSSRSSGSFSGGGGSSRGGGASGSW